MKSSRVLPILALSISFVRLPSAHADVKLPALFSDHAVLQRGQAVPVWGAADAGEDVSVTIAGQTQTTKAGADGKWKVSLKPLKEAESLVLTVKGKNTLTVNDVAVGEVWVASGQSNMAYRLLRDANVAAATAAATDPQLRFLTVGTKSSDTPLTDVNSTWVASDPKSAETFSAVAYYFARDLRKKLNIPVGIIHSSVGGTPAEAWTSREAIEANETLKKELNDAQQKAIEGFPAAAEKYKTNEAKLLEDWKVAAEKAKAAGKPEPRKPAAPVDPAKSNNRPSGLYNAMMAPLQPYGIRGVIWYQGESNSGRPEQYRTLFPVMIADWRKVWNQGDFPFLFVQVAPFNFMSPEIREAQLITLDKSTNTAMAVITDVGDANDIHPKQKEPVGGRLALAARALAYGEKIEYSGPLFDSLKVDGNKAVLKFKHGAGLAAKDGPLKGFTIAGEDKKYVPAKAEIAGDTVVVTADSVTKPIGVRYGWANFPEVNLYNGAGLPASPFRTDAPK
jgi:sialate O-acetylesterase